MRCVECGVSQQEHRAAYGTALEVRRQVYGSAYSMDGCVTLRKRCHGPKPRSPRGQGGGCRIALDLEPDGGVAVRFRAVVAGASPSKVVAALLRQALAAEIGDARKYVPRRKQEGPGS
jgi:hypothetical protein